MKYFMLLAFIFFSGSTLAKPQTKKLAQATFDRFLACGNLKGDSALHACLVKVTAKDLSETTRLMLFDYLHQGYRFSKLRDCQSQDKIQVFESKKGHVYFCLDVLGQTSKLQGYAEFKQEKNSLGLSAIRYGR